MKRLVWTVLGYLLATGAFANFGFPPELALPPQVGEYEGQDLLHEALAELSFETDATGANSVTQRGEHFKRWLRYTPKAGEPALGFYNGSEERIYNAIWGSLKAAGWAQRYVAEDKTVAVFYWQKPGREIWLKMSLDAPQAYVGLEAIVPASVARTLQHAVPKSVAETFSDHQPFPYLSPMPGSSNAQAGLAEGPLDVSLAFGANASTDPVLIGNSVRSRAYQGSKTLSALQFMTEQRAALMAAGWQVLYPANPEQDAAAGTLIAHYRQGNRDLWASLSIEWGGSYTYRVVDLGHEDWASRLKQDCRLPLFGVQFDFNQATLKPVSEAILSKAAAAIAGVPNSAVEVQGHTDAIGDDASNQKLSERRAQAVLAWLSSHGVPAARLSAKGYGESQPVADNGTDEGRAQNRRVELHLPGCQAH